VKTDTNGDTFISKSDSNKASYLIYTTDNYPRFYLTSDGSTEKSVTATTSVIDNDWHFVTGVFSPSTSMKIYFDGVLENTNTTSIPATIYDTDISFKIGTSLSSGSLSGQWNGSIQSPFIYNRALSAGEISQIYENTKHLFGK